MHLDKQSYKNQDMKNWPQHYNYSSNNASYIFKPNAETFVCQRILKNLNEIMV